MLLEWGLNYQNNASSRIHIHPKKAKSGHPHRFCGGKFSRIGAKTPVGSLISLGIRGQIDQALGTEADFEASDRLNGRSGWKYGI